MKIERKKEKNGGCFIHSGRSRGDSKGSPFLAQLVASEIYTEKFKTNCQVQQVLATNQNIKNNNPLNLLMLKCFQCFISALFSSAKGRVWCALIKKHFITAVM